MDKYELLLKDIKLILETIPDIHHVSFGKVAPLDIETTFTSVYISPEVDEFSLHKNGMSLAAYMNTFYIRLTVNMDCEDDLAWVPIRSRIINSILNDDIIWTNIVDRDIISVAHDDYENYPRKTMALLFSFKLEEDCII